MDKAAMRGTRQDENSPSGATGPDGPALDPNPDALADFLRSHDFDSTAYIHYYKDLARLDAGAALDHYARHGFREGRKAPFSLSMSTVQALRLTEWTDGWRAEMGRRATHAALWTLDPSGRDLRRFIDLLTPSPDHVTAIVIGDSHSAFLAQATPMLAAGIMPAPMICSGGSARGLSNSHSRAGYRTYILDRLKRLGQMIAHRPVVMKFGQVDIEFLFDLMRVRDGKTRYDPERMRAFIDDTVERYAGFLADCRAVCRGRLIVMSVFPPTLGDATIRAGYVNAHIAFLNEEDDADRLKAQLAALDHPDQVERTAVARHWNERIADMCARMGLDYLEEFDALLGEDGLIQDELSDPGDHHIILRAPRAQARIAAVAERLRAMVLDKD
ncbi:hypothetical protein [Sphingobium sp. OAS761]|uniref:hypothetical protein n=1 Tax=Sphingobium sp. OAS761 TaxID=2817901 RepID=UPI00209E9C4F|nr:hypothetical protein [Sphingobium sp. OAS761]